MSVMTHARVAGTPSRPTEILTCPNPSLVHAATLMRAGHLLSRHARRLPSYHTFEPHLIDQRDPVDLDAGGYPASAVNTSWTTRFIRNPQRW